MADEEKLGLSNGYIYQTLVREIKVSHLFADVYAADTVDVALLKKMRRFIFISNLAESDEIGTHFVCVVGKPNELIYIDSFGLPASTSSSLFSSLRKFDLKIREFYKSPVQHLSSHFCGMFVIYFTLLHDYLRMPITSGLKSFSKSRLRNNEKVLMKNLKNLLSKNPTATKKNI